MSYPIRILHVIGMLNRGGAETMIMNLYRNIDRSRIQFDFVQNDGPEAAFDKEVCSLGGRIYHCPRYRGKNHFAYVQWWHTFFQEHREEYPVVHGHIGSTAAIYLSIAKKYGAYTIAHSHNTKASIMYRLLSFPTRFIANHFFACSRAAGISRYGTKIGTDKQRCMVLNNAIDVAKFVVSDEVRHDKRCSLGVSEDQLVIGNVARFSNQKNHLFLLEVFEKVHEMHEDAVLLLVGDGELRQQIENSIVQRKLENCVILTGVQKNTSDYYQAADIILMPSLYEGLPVSLVEAQAAGLPCCVSTGVPRETAITDLVQFKSLDESADQWAQWVLERAHTPREDMSEEMKKAGYDISETAQWLQNFYLEVVKSHE